MSSIARGVYVPLFYKEKEQLLALAQEERRSPRQQAAILIERALASARPGGQSTEQRQIKATAQDQ